MTTDGGSDLDSNDLMAAEEYPDPSTGDPSSSQETTYTYSALGQIDSMTDRDGTTHQYTYEKEKRTQLDSAV